MKKLIIQIPCYNEEESLPVTLSFMPRELEGVDKVEWMVIDDGSTDNTVKVALENGVDHVVRHPKNMGLAIAFMTGLNECLKKNADIIVNTDADNQYDASCIKDLIRPIIDGEAEYVIGARPINETRHFSWIKKFLQKAGSWTVRFASNTDIPDAPSGFRAISKSAAFKLNVFSDYTYTLETIIQAGQKNIPITWVPVRTNEDLRPSRLVKSIPAYVRRSILTILRIFVVYKAFRFFSMVGSVLLFAGLLLGVRFLFFFFSGEGEGHIQSLILSAILIGMGFQTLMTAFVADLLSVNRNLLEELQSYQRMQTVGRFQNENDHV